MMWADPMGAATPKEQEAQPRWSGGMSMSVTNHRQQVYLRITSTNGDQYPPITMAGAMLKTREAAPSAPQKWP